MARWIIRAVDWGNIQRSPTFEAIFIIFTQIPTPYLYP